MSIIDFPNFRVYWSNETRYPIIADILSRNRYQKLKEFLHVSDNLEKKNPQNINIKFSKIQPVLDHVKSNCILIDPEREHSTDEQIIPTKTKLVGFVSTTLKNKKNGVLKISLGPDHQI